MEAEPSASTEGAGFAGLCFHSPSALGKDSQDPKQAPTALHWRCGGPHGEVSTLHRWHL